MSPFSMLIFTLFNATVSSLFLLYIFDTFLSSITHSTSITYNSYKNTIHCTEKESKCNYSLNCLHRSIITLSTITIRQILNNAFYPLFKSNNNVIQITFRRHNIDIVDLSTAGITPYLTKRSMSYKINWNNSKV